MEHPFDGRPNKEALDQQALKYAHEAVELALQKKI
jgi:hypothetical protein